MQYFVYVHKHAVSYLNSKYKSQINKYFEQKYIKIN